VKRHRKVKAYTAWTIHEPVDGFHDRDLGFRRPLMTEYFYTSS